MAAIFDAAVERVGGSTRKLTVLPEPDQLVKNKGDEGIRLDQFIGECFREYAGMKSQTKLLVDVCRDVADIPLFSEEFCKSIFDHLKKGEYKLPPLAIRPEAICHLT